MGEEVEFLNLDEPEGFVEKLKKFFTGLFSKEQK